MPSLGPGSIKSPSNRQMIQEAKTKGQTENLLSSRESGPVDGASNGINFLSTFQQESDEVLELQIRSVPEVEEPVANSRNAIRIDMPNLGSRDGGWTRAPANQI